MSTYDPNQYKALNQIDHVLLRAGMYVGECFANNNQEKCYDSQTKKITIKNVTTPEALVQIFLELLANASDNIQNTKIYNSTCQNEGKQPLDLGVIECTLNSEWCSVKNYGLTIPIERHPTEGILVPTLIFGRLLSSSNYNDDKVRSVVGLNGIGGKAANIFSKQFIVECSDPTRKLLFRQVWSNNMKTVGEPVIVPYNGIGYTQVSFSPDFPRFGVQEFDMQAQQIFMGHCCVASYTCGIPVIFNGEKLHFQTITDYAKLFFDFDKDSSITFTDKEKVYDVCLCDTPDNGIMISFVNGIVVRNGGVHVDQIMTTIVDSIKEFFGKMIEGITLTKRDIVNHISLFISARLTNPSFKGQQKEYLQSLLPITGPNGQQISRKLPSVDIPEKLIGKIKNWKIIERIHAEIEQKQLNKLKKTDGKSKNPKVEKLIDANFAKDVSTRHLTTLLMCEGDSASAYLEIFQSFYPNGTGPDYCGILPLSGKMLNTLNANFLQLLNNTVINNIKKALNLEEGLDYRIPANFRKLRYSQILMIPDADVDGAHVTILCVLFFLTRFYSLVQIGYIKFLRTPIITVKKGNATAKFYTQAAYNTWKSRNPDYEKWHHNYFKGLASSTADQIKEEFDAPRIVRFYIDANTKENIEMAFSKVCSDKRKEWLNKVFNSTVPDMENIVDMPISNYINYELSGYSEESVIRCIPEAFDGMKDCQRKAFYVALKRLDTKDKTMKVAQLASAAAELTCYKHGEGSLAEAIVNMTQNYVGANNMPLFSARGLFGSRGSNGANAGNPRYTHVGLAWWVPHVFRKEDRNIEKPIIDEGEPCESENFYSILPMHVINGSVGIGTGWSCTHHKHNPLDIAFWLQCRLAKNLQPDKNIPMPQIKPWVRGWNGRVELKKNGFISHGIYQITNPAKKEITITELPINCWTLRYKQLINKMEEDGTISQALHYSVMDTVKIIVRGYTGEMEHDKIMKKFKLSKVHSYTNMTVIYRKQDRRIQPHIYTDLQVLLEDFFKIRLAKYAERKQYMLNSLQEEINKMTLRAKFIHLVNEGHIVILKRPEAEILAKMATFQLPEELYDLVKAREFSADRVQELMNKVAEKQTEYNTVVATSIEAMWYSDLENFIVKYCQHEKVGRSSYETTGVYTPIQEEIPVEALKEQEKEDVAEMELIAEEKRKEEQIKLEDTAE